MIGANRVVTNPADREKGKHTRVVCSTFANRGKSLTPESRMDMLDDNSAFVDRKDETQEASGFAILEDLFTPQDDLACE